MKVHFHDPFILGLHTVVKLALPFCIIEVLLELQLKALHMLAWWK